MKIAIPTRGNNVDDHFGHCEFYTLFSVSDDNRIEDKEMYNAPHGCGCKSNVADILKQKGVTTMLAGNMGQGAVNKILSAGIKVYRGCSGDVQKLTEAFLKNEISDSGETCNHHHHRHDNGRKCNHE